jgi:hypothetical protein
MKNQITLSLITAAILGLTGCGPTDSATPSEASLSSIQKLSNASTKHEKSDWIAIENAIQGLDNTEKFNTILLGSIEKNVASLTTVGIDKEMAYAMNSDAIYDDLIQLDITDLDNQVVAECREDDKCKEEAYSSIKLSLDIDKEMAYEMSVMYRGDIGKPSTMDGLLKEFTCATGLVRKVQFYGVEDNFVTSNGDEVAYPSSQVVNNAAIQAYGGTGLSNYDFSTPNTLFAEEVKNLPAGIANGHFYIGMKNHGSNDGITLGNLDENSSTEDVFSGTIASNNAGLSKSAQVYHAELSDIDLADGSTLKNYAYNHGGFDVYVQDDTFVDFIAVATCSKPNPIKDITDIVNEFECSEKETLVKIFGGELDNFAPTGDANNPANPSATLSAYTQYPTTGYDATSYDRHFIDTLTNIPTGTITKAKFSMGYKVIGSSLYSNDVMYLGEMGKNHMGLQVYNTNLSQTVAGYGQILTSDLMTPNTLGTGTVFDSLVNNRYLDVYVQDDTAVDFTQLNLCVTDSCSEDAKDIELDLSQLASWTDVPSDARENRSVSSWDNTLNWFEFDQNQKDKVLEIPFCACGDTLVTVNHLKGDNIAEVELDSMSVAYQPWTLNGVTGFISDSAGGNHVDGSQALTGTGLGVNHVLKLKARNLYSSGGSPTPFGIALEGTLNFKGYLGKCK